MEMLYNDRRSGLDVILHNVHDFLEAHLRRFGRSQEVANKLVGLSSNSAEQHCTLLVCRLYIICDEVLLKALHVGLPGFLSVLEFANRPVSGHGCQSILVANVVS